MRFNLSLRSTLSAIVSSFRVVARRKHAGLIDRTCCRGSRVLLALACFAFPAAAFAQTAQFPPTCAPLGPNSCASRYPGPWSYSNRLTCTGYPPRSTESAAVQDIITDYTRPTNCSLSVTPVGGWYSTGPISIAGCGFNLNYAALPYLDQNTGIETENYRPYSVDYSAPIPTCTPGHADGHTIRKGRDLFCPLGMMLDYYGTSVVNGITYSASYCRGTGTQPPKNLGSCSSSGGGGGSPSLLGNPINAGIGNKVQVEADYSGPPEGVRFERTYNSGGTIQSQSSAYFGSAWFTQIGAYWRHTYDRSLIQTVSAAITTVSAYRSDGRILSFNLYNSAYYPDSDISDRLVALSGNTGWKYTTAQDEVEMYDSSGKLQSITSRRGVVQTMTYSTSSTPVGIAPTPGLLINVTDSFGRQLNFTYDSAARIVTMTDPAGGIFQYAYGASNNLTSVTAPDGKVRTYVYNEAAYVSGVDEPNALTGIVDESNVRYATYQYDSSGRATFSGHAGGVDNNTLVHNADGTVSATDPLGKVRTYAFAPIHGVRKNTSISAVCSSCGSSASAATSYDANGNTASKTDFNGNVTNYVFDLTRNLESSRTEAYGTPRARTITTTWHPTFRLPDVVTEPNRIIDHNYNAAGNLLTKAITDTSVTPNVTRTWTYTYNAYGQVLTENGPRTDVSDVTTYTYYSCTTGYQCGRLQTATNALSQITTYNTYNAHGQPLTITAPNNIVTTLTYDARQRLTSRTVGSEATTFEYWPTGSLKKIILPDSSYLLYTYDNAHRLFKIEDGSGNRIQYTLDAMGNRTAENVYDPSSVLTGTRTRVFNNLNQLWKEIGAAGTAAVTTEFAYDSNGNQTNMNAPLSRNTVNAYDELNRLKQITDPASGVTQFGYDSRDNLTSVTDPRSLATNYTYTGFGDLKTQVSPDTGTTTNTYDSGGNLKTSTDARNAITTYTYDALNRVKTAAFKIGSTTDQTITYSYDAGTNGKGHLTGASDANHSLAWTYDALGRVIGKGQTIGAVTKSVGYGYTSGRLTTMTLPSGQVVTYGYNSNNQVTSVTVGATTVLSSATYQPFGPVKGWSWGNATTMTRTFDTDGKLSQFNSGGLKTYAYDDAFRITGITDTVTAANSYTYGYDALDRITSGSKTGTTYGWTYDANGNRLSQTGSGASTYTISGTKNRISSITGALARTYTYDAAGNTLGYTNATATYNNRGRMKTLVKASVTATYVYNALGQRIKRSGGTPGTVLYMYDEAGHLIGEYSSTGVLVQETVWLGDIPVATLRPNGASVLIYYVHTDHLNTPIRVTRPSDNKLMWRWYASPFGTDAPNENPASGGTFKYNLRFAGQLYDSHAGLHQNYFRDYDPATGRYIESDPRALHEHAESLFVDKKIAPLMRNAGTHIFLNSMQIPFELNPYLYTFNNPVRWIDPNGESGALGGAIIVGGTCFVMYCTLKASKDCNSVYPGHESDPASHRKFMQCVSKTVGACLKLGQLFMDPIGEATETVIEKNCDACQP